MHPLHPPVVPEASFVCCSEPPPAKRVFRVSEYISEIVEAIEVGDFNKDELKTIARALGKSQSKVVYDDSVNIAKQFRDDALMTSFDIDG